MSADDGFLRTAMTQILFIQGAGKDVHDDWDNKLVDSLQRELGPSYEIRYPRMPHEANPTLRTWQPALKKEFATLRNGAIVVGHSVGGTILINTLLDSAPAVTLSAIVLMATPFIGKGGWPSDDIKPRTDFAERLPTGVPVLLYHGETDDVVPVAHVDLYAKAIPHAHVRRLAGRDHQLNNDLSEVANDIRALESPAS